MELRPNLRTAAITGAIIAAITGDGQGEAAQSPTLLLFGKILA